MKNRLVFDIETIGENFDELDGLSQKYLLRFEESEEEIERKKTSLGFSPLTGKVAAIGMYNPETKQGKVFFQAPGTDLKKSQEGSVEYLPMEEKEILAEFWAVAEKFDEFVTFNGRCFDVPFLSIRSAIHQIRPSKDLMSNRYLGSQRGAGASHVDLLDQFTFYGASPRQKLHFFCRAFGIKTPKDGEVSGEGVGQAFKDGQYLEIARYCFDDVLATSQLFDYWDKYLRF